MTIDIIIMLMISCTEGQMKILKITKGELNKEIKQLIMFTLNKYYMKHMGEKFYFIFDFHGCSMINMVMYVVTISVM